MTPYQTIIGISGQNPDLAARKQRWLTSETLQLSKTATSKYADDNLLLIAPVILCCGDFVIAANPVSERDNSALRSFSKTWVMEPSNALELIKNYPLACCVVIYHKGLLVLTRDRLGIDNFYYCMRDEQLVFSNSGSALVGDKLDSRSALNYLLYGRPRLGATLFESIRSLEAAHFLTFSQGNITIQRYWSPRINPMPLSSRESRLDILEKSLTQACHECFAENSNAIFLSGGIDSSYIASIAGQKHHNTTCCYTISYADKQYKDESHYAQIVSDAYRLKLKKVELSSENILHYLARILEEPQPIGAWASICNHALIDAAIADGNTNILSGLGSDEVLANYDKALDYYFRVREFINQSNTADLDLLDHTECVDKLMFPGVADFFSHESLQAILTPEINMRFATEDLRAFYRTCGAVNQNTHLFSYIVAHECHHRIPDLLLRNFNSYALRRGTQILYPFLDPDFVECACSLYPQERFQYQNNRWHSKVSLKLIVADRLPAAILKRERGTFDFPFQAWLKQDAFYTLVREKLERSRIWEINLFKEHVLDNYLNFMKRNKENKPIENRRWPNELWALLTLSAWHGRYLS
jgi:asparagine synthetase B (glutamine-hydrolysing)